jgi:hypothetical protein
LKKEKNEGANRYRYLLKTVMDKVKAPKDIEYLKSILPKLEGLKAKMAELIDYDLESIVDTKTKTKIAHHLRTEVLK